jgi:outer membrane lipoprotein-sorting protein
MFRKTFAWLLMSVLAAAAVSAQTVDELVEKSLKAQGGRDKIVAIKSLRMTGKMEMGGGMQMPIKMEAINPDKMRFEGTLQGMTLIQALNGSSGWQIMPFMGKTDPEPMSDDDVKQAKKQMESFDMLTKYKEYGHTLELVGKEDLEGSPTYKLKLTRKDGDVSFLYLDAESFLLIKSAGKTKMQGQEIDSETAIGDYKDVGNGVMMAHSMETKVKGQPGGMVMTLEKIELNPEIPTNDFVMPKVEKKPEQEKKPEPAPAKPPQR